GHRQSDGELAALSGSTIYHHLAAVCLFFQAEDGIRDRTVTGVQTCALPILWPLLRASRSRRKARKWPYTRQETPRVLGRWNQMEIGRASCRERVQICAPYVFCSRDAVDCWRIYGHPHAELLALPGINYLPAL